MASSTPSGIVHLETRLDVTPLWLWPNLLSLDAAAIASIWQTVFARDAGVQLSLSSRIELPLVVWLIYVLDRLLDNSQYPLASTARHRFYFSHQQVFWRLAILATVCGTILTLFLPLAVFDCGLSILTLVLIYLLVVHGLGGSLRKWLPKELAVGALFTAGAMLAPAASSSHITQLFLPGLLFSILCWLNSAAIEVWEGGAVDVISAAMVHHLKAIVATIAVVCALALHQRPFSNSLSALMCVALGYALVDYLRPSLNRNQLRVSIDVPLLTPLIFLSFR